LATDPDVVLLDFDSTREPPEHLLSAIKSLDHPPAVVVMSVRAEKQQDAFSAGADAFAYKGEAPDRLLSSIRAVGEISNKQPS
jgi:DNA-binding NarL/FixJ family response regulator